MYVMSCLSCLESRPFWQHWQTLCLVYFVAGLRWLVHVHGSWITLQALQKTEWTLVWLLVKGWMCTSQITWSPTRLWKDAAFSSTTSSHHLPAAPIPLGLIRNCFSRLALSLCSPCSPLLSLCCLQAGCWHPHRGQ